MDFRSRRAQFWRELRLLRRKAPTVYYGIALLAIAELAVIFVAPLFVPEHIYLRLYMSSRAEAKTRDFARDGDPFLAVDSITGWRGRPNSQRGKWVLDSLGGRTTHPYQVQKTRAERVLLLGNSLTNGGMHVENNETISAYIEDSLMECLNFATMLYSVDQMYLSYKHYLRSFKPDAVVIGIHGEPLDGLDNRYIPLWRRREDNMPMFKPRFRFLSDSMTLVLPLPPSAYKTILDSPDAISSLRDSDRYYQRFQMYKRFGLLPMSSAVWSITNRAASLAKLSRRLDDSETRLFLSILKRLETDVTGEGAFLLVLVFPDETQAYPSPWRRFFPDKYGQLVSSLRAEGFHLVDARQFLQRSGLAPNGMYSPDGLHFTPAGNRVIAAALKQTIVARAETVGGARVGAP